MVYTLQPVKHMQIRRIRNKTVIHIDLYNAGHALRMYFCNSPAKTFVANVLNQQVGYE